MELMRRRRGIMGLNGGGVPIIAATASGNPLSFVTDMVRPLKSLVIPFTPIQDGSGDPSPDNVRPISGWTGCIIRHTGKNWMECVSANKIGSGVTVSNGVLSAAKNNTTEAGIVFPAKPNTCYALSFTKRSGGNIYVRCAEYSSKPKSYSSHRIRELIHDESSSTGVVKKNITTGNNAKYVFFGFYRSYSASTVNADSWCANLYDDGYGYEEYKGTAIPVTFTDPTTGDPMTVYGGTLTLNEDGSVDLVKSWESKDLGNLNWLQSPTPNCFYYSGSAVPYRKTGRIMCSCFKNDGGRTTSPWYGADGTFRYYDGTSNLREIYVHDERYSSASAFKDGVTGEMFVYEIGSPKTYHFDNIGQLITFVGTNNIWTDTNDTNTATYLKHQS